jgi:hypothetical protein
MYFLKAQWICYVKTIHQIWTTSETQLTDQHHQIQLGDRGQSQQGVDGLIPYGESHRTLKVHDRMKKAYTVLTGKPEGRRPLERRRRRREDNIKMNMRVSWHTSPCSLLGVDLRFRGAYCLHHQGNDSSPWRWNVGVIRDYTALYPKSLLSLHSTTWEPKISEF